mmetsp:Transcript_18656/g.63001  ORF Transcript_18656/g.63001 Transcript_18656/m.63001 type:complete len:225 (-) Transcript_18656:742-1416(-)
MPSPASTRGPSEAGDRAGPASARARLPTRLGSNPTPKTRAWIGPPASRSRGATSSRRTTAAPPAGQRGLRRRRPRTSHQRIHSTSASPSSTRPVAASETRLANSTQSLSESIRRDARRGPALSPRRRPAPNRPAPNRRLASAPPRLRRRPTTARATPRARRTTPHRGRLDAVHRRARLVLVGRTALQTRMRAARSQSRRRPSSGSRAGSRLPECATGRPKRRLL